MVMVMKLLSFSPSVLITNDDSVVVLVAGAAAADVVAGVACGG